MSKKIARHMFDAAIGCRIRPSPASFVAGDEGSTRDSTNIEATRLTRSPMQMTSAKGFSILRIHLVVVPTAGIVSLNSCRAANFCVGSGSLRTALVNYRYRYASEG